MRASIHSWKQTVEMTGTGDAAIPVNNEFTFTQITITGLAAGIAEVKAKALNGDFFETVTDGAISLATTRTVVIQDMRIEALQFEDTGAAYTVEINQY